MCPLMLFIYFSFVDIFLRIRSENCTQRIGSCDIFLQLGFDTPKRNCKLSGITENSFLRRWEISKCKLWNFMEISGQPETEQRDSAFGTFLALSKIEARTYMHLLCSSRHCVTELILMSDFTLRMASRMQNFCYHSLIKLRTVDLSGYAEKFLYSLQRLFPFQNY